MARPFHGAEGTGTTRAARVIDANLAIVEIARHRVHMILRRFRPRRGGVVALLTDFGTTDWYVAAMKAVILARAPRVQLIDITHAVPPHDIIAGAFILAAAAPAFPRGTIFAAVVDPGVGTARALLAARADGRYFIGPDNGLLTLSLKPARSCRVVRLTDRHTWLPTISQTFHGRDIIAPVAAYLACGGTLDRLGPSHTRLVPLDLGQLKRRGRWLWGQVVHIDSFGNLITNLSLPASPGPKSGEAGRAHCRLRGYRSLIPVVSSYAAGRPRQLIAVVGSLGLIELALRDGAAAQWLRVRRGDRVALSVRTTA